MGRLDEYKVGKAAGKGKFSTVYRAKRLSDNKTIALKKINVGTFPRFLFNLLYPTHHTIPSQPPRMILNVFYCTPFSLSLSPLPQTQMS